MPRREQREQAEEINDNDEDKPWIIYLYLCLISAMSDTAATACLLYWGLRRHCGCLACPFHADKHVPVMDRSRSSEAWRRHGLERAGSWAITDARITSACGHILSLLLALARTACFCLLITLITSHHVT